MERRESELLAEPAQVLDMACVARIGTLRLQRDLFLAMAFGRREKQAADALEPFERFIRPGKVPVTVGPFIVTGRIDQRFLEIVEQRAHAQVNVITAAAGAGLDVAKVQREYNRLAVQP